MSKKLVSRGSLAHKILKETQLLKSINDAYVSSIFGKPKTANSYTAVLEASGLLEETGDRNFALTENGKAILKSLTNENVSAVDVSGNTYVKKENDQAPPSRFFQHGNLKTPNIIKRGSSVVKFLSHLVHVAPVSLYEVRVGSGYDKGEVFVKTLIDAGLVEQYYDEKAKVRKSPTRASGGVLMLTPRDIELHKTMFKITDTGRKVLKTLTSTDAKYSDLDGNPVDIKGNPA